MKKLTVLLLLCLVVSVTAFSQGFYLDLGIGIGYFSQSIEGENIGKALKDYYSAADIKYIPFNFGVSVNLKSGFGPFKALPLFFVGDFYTTWAAMGAINDDVKKEEEWLPGIENYFIGPGVIFYPLSFLQIGASLGFAYFYGTTVFSSVDNFSLITGGNNSEVSIDEDDIWKGGGFGWHLSIGFNLGKREKKGGLLISADYFGSTNRIQQEGKGVKYDAQASQIGVSLKFCYKKKITSLF